MRRPGTPSGMSSVYSSQTSLSSMSPSKETVYSGNIKVSVRVKPALNSNATIATSQDGSIITFNDTWSIDGEQNMISTKDIGEFSFDNVFHGPIENSKIFDASVGELVNQVVAGYNGTVFAYGMTGSGKTYSMQGSATNPGIIPLSVKAIFDQIKSPSASDPSRAYTVKVSYLEIYNEHLHDLLSPSTPSDDIKLRDDPVRGVRALGLKEVTVESPEELIECIQTGDALRRTEGTEFNSNSSRSHAVVQITIESSPKRPGTIAPRASTLYLCDLAGSERAASQTERRKEGAYINKSLLTLGTVIARLSVASSASLGPSLGGGSSNAGHIPYRDSKLTRLLQPALSGKSLVSVICTVDVCNLAANGETVSTLRFAARAKNILVSAKRNEDAADPNTKLIEKLMVQIDALKSENATLRAGGATLPSGPMVGANNATSSPSTIKLVSQITQLEAENRILNERVEHLTRLCDDDRLEDVIGLGIEDSSNASSPINPNFNRASTPSRSSSVSSMNSSEDRFPESAWKRKENEYKSYTAHLEKQIYMLEMQKRSTSSTSSLDARSPELPNGNGSTAVASMFPPVRSQAGGAGPSNGGSQPPSHFAEMIAELKEEIEELKESNSDKDRIISTLRSINKRKENLASLASSSPVSASHSTMGGNAVPSSPYSAAYNRYYFSPSASPAIPTATATTTPSKSRPTVANKENATAVLPEDDDDEAVGDSTLTSITQP